MDDNMHRCHPAMIPDTILKYTPFVLIAFLSSVLSALKNGGSFAPTFCGLAALLAVAAMLAAVDRQFTMYGIENNSFVYKRGIIIKRTVIMPIDKIVYCSAECELLSLFGALRVSIDAKHCRRKGFNASLLLSKKQAQQLIECICGKGENAPLQKPQLKKTVLLAAVVSDSASGLALLSPVLSFIGKLLNTHLTKEIYDRTDIIAKKYLSILPPVFGTAALILLLGWIISFLHNLERYSRIRTVRGEKTVMVKAGVVFPRWEMLSGRAVSAVKVSRTLLGCLLNLGSVYLVQSGFSRGKSKGLLLPMQSRDELRRYFGDSLVLSGGKIKIARHAWYKLIMLPLLSAAGIILLQVYISLQFPFLKAAALIIGAFALTFCLYYAAISAQEYKYCELACFNGGIRMTGRHKNRICTLSAQRGYYTVRIKRTIFQKRDNTCTVILAAMSDKTEKYKLRHAVYDKTDEYIKGNL